MEDGGRKAVCFLLPAWKGALILADCRDREPKIALPGDDVLSLSWYKLLVTLNIRLKYSLCFFLFLILVVPAPAFAYGDPSGGYLFQILTPILALLWGTWLAFAHTIRKWLSRMVERMKGKKSVERSQEQAGEVETLGQSVEQVGVPE